MRWTKFNKPLTKIHDWGPFRVFHYSAPAHLSFIFDPEQEKCLENSARVLWSAKFFGGTVQEMKVPEFQVGLVSLIPDSTIGPKIVLTISFLTIFFTLQWESKTWTLDFTIKSQLFCHCATCAQPVLNIKFWFFHNLLIFIISRAFVPNKLFQAIHTNVLAKYENS